MKKIILSIVALIAILWVAMFVTETRVLVWEVSPKANFEGCEAEVREINRKRAKEGKTGKILSMCSTYNHEWSCTYFNGRRLITRNYQSYVDACPNLL